MSPPVRFLSRPTLAFTLLTVLLACTGNLETGAPGPVGTADDDGPDAGTTAPVDDVGVDAGVSQLACDDPVDTQARGEHNPGQACNACHAAEGERIFTAAGTIYDALVSDVPVVGATVHLVDANGKEVTLVTALNGNFYTEEPLVYPVKTWAGKCPDVEEMFAPVQAAGADCNMGGCHDSDFRIHLP